MEKEESLKIDNENIENKWYKIGFNSVYIISSIFIIFNSYTDRVSFEVILIFSTLLLSEAIAKYKITKKKKYIIIITIEIILAVAALGVFFIDVFNR